MNERQYTSRRYSILKALAEVLKTINGQDGSRSNVWNNVHPKLAFWDEVSEYPAIYLGLGNEQRIYQGGGYKDRFLSIAIRLYVNEADPQNALELLLEDIETVIEQNGRLAYQDSSGSTQFTQDILILSIDTDEGALDAIGVGDMLIQVRY